MEEERPERLSQVVPFLMAALVCDAAATDPNTGKKSLLGIFDRIQAVEFPTRRVVTLYFRIGDAEGRYRMSVKFVSLKDGTIIYDTDAEISIPDRLATSELEVVINPLEIPAPGKYELQLWANSAYVGATSIVASTMARQPPML